MNTISIPNAPAPAGHYSQAVEVDGFVFLSGILPSADRAGGLASGIEEQTRSVLDQVQSILAAAGCSLEDVVQCMVFIVGVDHWPPFNRVYAERLGSHRPARTVVPVPELRHGALIELQVTARRA